MKLWIAEESQQEIVLHSPSKENLLTEVRRQCSFLSQTDTHRWELWAIDPSMNREFLQNLISNHFSFHDIERVNKSWHVLYFKAGKIVKPSGKVKRDKDPRPSGWTV